MKTGWYIGDDFISSRLGDGPHIRTLAHYHKLHRPEWRSYEPIETHWSDGEELLWQGRGWYASRQEWGRVRTFWVGGEPDREPDVYTQGLGTPEWLDGPFGEKFQKRG